MPTIDQSVINRELDRVRTLRTSLVLNHPFFATLLLPMRLQISLGLPTFAATNGTDTIWINPAWTAPLSLKQLGYVLLHEVGHCALLHAARKGPRQHELWNDAADLSDNAMIDGVANQDGTLLYTRPDGVTVPGVGTVRLLHADWAHDLSTELIYNTLLHNPELALPSPATAAPDTGSLPPPPGHTSGGSQEPDWSRASCRPGSTCAFVPPALSHDQIEQLTDRVIAAHEAWIASDRRGAVPAGVLRLIEQLRQARVPWQRVLHQYAGAALTRDDYSLMPPHRRWLIDSDIVRPSLRSEALGDLVISIDTSGSITRAILREFAAEAGKLATLAEETLILTHDAAVHQVVPTAEVPAFLHDLTFKGGGGTSHVPVFEYLRERRHTPELLVSLTDLHSEFPDDPPTYPVLWCTTDDHGTPPDWGRVILIPEPAEAGAHHE